MMLWSRHDHFIFVFCSPQLSAFFILWTQWWKQVQVSPIWTTFFLFSMTEQLRVTVTSAVLFSKWVPPPTAMSLCVCDTLLFWRYTDARNQHIYLVFFLDRTVYSYIRSTQIIQIANNMVVKQFYCDGIALELQKLKLKICMLSLVRQGFNLTFS